MSEQQFGSLSYRWWLVAIALTILGIYWINAQPSPVIEGSERNVVVPACSDAFVYESQPDANFGAAGALAVTGSSEGKRFETFLKFDLNGLKTVVERQLQKESWHVTQVELILHWQFKHGERVKNELFEEVVNEPAGLNLSLLPNAEWEEGAGRPRESLSGTSNSDIMTWTKSRQWVTHPSALSLGSFDNLRYPESRIVIKLDGPVRDAVQDSKSITLRLEPMTATTNVFFCSRTYNGGGGVATLNINVEPDQN